MRHRAGDSEQGIIPLRVRVGVTGHRHLIDSAAIDARIREAFSDILSRVTDAKNKDEEVKRMTPLLTVVSPLAQGADQLVADVALAAYADKTTLEVPVPEEPEAYLAESFEDNEHGRNARRHFDELCKAADLVRLKVPEEDKDAFDVIGRYVVEHSDFLIAIWDGGRARGLGGTALIVEYARSRGLPVFWIHSDGEHEIKAERMGDSSTSELFRWLRRFNSEPFLGRIDKAGLRWMANVVAMAERLDPDVIDVIKVVAALDSVAPFYARADNAARRYQWLHNAVNAAIFGLAAAAVSVVALQAAVFHDQSWLVALEIVSLVTLFGLWIGGTLFKVRDCWISYRFLAERLRAAPFLALTGPGKRGPLTTLRVASGHATEAWIQRAYGEVWRHWQEAPSSAWEHRGLRRFLADAWIDDQIDYYQERAQRNRRKHAWFTRLIILLFFATLLAAVAHLLSEEGGSWSKAVTWLAIALPAVSGALGGLRAQREFLRNSERYLQMVHVLEQKRAAMDSAMDLPAIARIAEETDEYLARETGEWVSIMKFHDFELP